MCEVIEGARKKERNKLYFKEGVEYTIESDLSYGGDPISEAYLYETRATTPDGVELGLAWQKPDGDWELFPDINEFENVVAKIPLGTKLRLQKIVV